MTGERGHLSVHVSVVALAVIVAAGLVVDGGRMLAARRQAHDRAAAAARAGAQALDVAAVRAGRPVLAPRAARAAALDHLHDAGVSGTVAVTEDLVTVDLSTTIELSLLRVVGLSHRTVTGRAAVRAVQSVEGV